MLLCVGSFFGSSEESKKEWEDYLAGNNSGGIFFNNLND